MGRAPIVLRAVGAVSALALAVWLGGLTVLGAVVAPTVFSVVSLPASADAMTLVFRRFDTVAMTCAAIAVACEALRAGLRAPFPRLAVVRAALTVVAAALTTYEGASISPAIAALHAAGAVRAVGPAGMELDRLHGIAEACGKASVALVAAVLVLLFLTASTPRAKPGA